ncbi:MAG: hypothetical protein K2G23_01400 [Muribaculaceae bacterium]|nr:hypothetical protein [Muribaculaceae bacterium]
MKHSFCNLAAASLMVILFNTAAFAESYPALFPNPDMGMTTNLVVIPKYSEKPELPPKGERKPSRKLAAHIGDGWVMIEGVDESEILSYDINGYDGFPLASFDSAPEFTETLFSLHGEYEVSFTTDEYIYTGYVWME